MNDWEYVSSDPVESARTATRRLEVVQVIQARAPEPEKQLPQWLTVEQALEVLPISKASLYRHIRNGEIPCKTIGKRRFISRDYILSEGGVQHEKARGKRHHN